MTTLNIRIDEKIKTKASKTFSSLGLDMSSGIKLFLTQVIKEDGLPFIPTNNKAILKERWEKQTVYALKYGKIYKTGKEVLSDLI